MTDYCGGNKYTRSVRLLINSRSDALAAYRCWPISLFRS